MGHEPISTEPLDDFAEHGTRTRREPDADLSAGDTDVVDETTTGDESDGSGEPE